MALSCFPKISPKLIITQPGNASAREGGCGGVARGITRRTTASGWLVGLVRNFVSFNTYTNPRAKPFNGSQKLTNHISTSSREGEGVGHRGRYGGGGV